MSYRSRRSARPLRFHFGFDTPPWRLFSPYLECKVARRRLVVHVPAGKNIFASVHCLHSRASETSKLTGSPLVPRQFRSRSQFHPGSRQSGSTPGSREVSSRRHMSHSRKLEDDRTVRVCHRKGLVRVLNACVGWFRLKIWICRSAVPTTMSG